MGANSAAFGVWCVVCGVWRAACGVWRVVCGCTEGSKAHVVGSGLENVHERLNIVVIVIKMCPQYPGGRLRCSGSTGSMIVKDRGGVRVNRRGLSQG